MTIRGSPPAAPTAAPDEVFLSGDARPDRLVSELKPGTRLGRFVIECALNSRGCVYLAQDTIADRPVAIKIARDGESTARLRHERQLYGRVKDHRHVLRAFDLHCVTWRNQDLLVLSMEHADGGNLRQWLGAAQQNQQYRRQTGLHYFRQCCLGTAALHRAGIVHRDLKPENLLLVGQNLKVADLGSTRTLNDLVNSESTDAAPSTTGLGTPQYTSPEQTHEYDGVGIQADIYSLGVIFYEIINPEGRLPFNPEVQVPHAALSPLTGVEPGHNRVMQRCLHPDPHQRYRSIEELLNDLGGQGTETRIDMLWQQACKHLEDRQMEEARRLCHLLLEQDPEHPDASRLLAELDERAQRAGRLYALMGQWIDTMSLDELCQMAQEAVELYPKHPDGQAFLIQLSARSRLYRQSMHNGLAAAREGQWDSARNWLQQAVAANPGSIEAKRPAQAIESLLLHVNDQRQQIDRALAQRDSQRALALARNLDKFKERALKSFTEHQNRGHDEHHSPSTADRPHSPVAASIPDAVA